MSRFMPVGYVGKGLWPEFDAVLEPDWVIKKTQLDVEEWFRQLNADEERA